MRPALSRARLLVGLLLTGQGLLVLTRILDHEAPLWLGTLTLAAGLGVLAWHAGASAPPRASETSARKGSVHVHLTRALGLAALGGVLLYNLLRGSDLAPPEVAIVVYGLALVWAAPRLPRRVWRADVGTLVAYSFPLVLVPLSLYALNAALVAGVGATPLAWYIQHGLVVPMAGSLGLLGIDVRMLGDTVRLATPAGALFLTVGVVCAGLYAAVMFLGVFALFAWEQRTRGWRLAAYLGLGLVGLHVANVLRLVLLALVGWRWGGDALQLFHQHAGWVLFLAWTVLFWWLVLRRFERPAHSRVT